MNQWILIAGIEGTYCNLLLFPPFINIYLFLCMCIFTPSLLRLVLKLCLTLRDPMDQRARQALLSSTAFWSCVKFMLVASVTLSSHLILCRPLLLLPSHFPNIKVFYRESFLLMRWPKSWSLSFRICPSSELHTTKQFTS